MWKLKIAVMSSVLALGLGQSAHAVYTQTQLEDLRVLIDGGDTQAILLFIQSNPSLLEGEDPLADALRSFVTRRETVLGRLFAPSVPDIDKVPDIPRGTSSDILLASGSLSDFGS